VRDVGLQELGRSQVEQVAELPLRHQAFAGGERDVRLLGHLRHQRQILVLDRLFEEPGWSFERLDDHHATCGGCRRASRAEVELRPETSRIADTFDEPR
jgi:hypothetical protein